MYKSWMHCTVNQSTTGCEAPSLGKEGKPGGHATRKRSLFAPTHTLPYISTTYAAARIPPWKRHTCGFCADSDWRGTQRAKAQIHTCVSWDPICSTCVPSQPLCGKYSYFTSIRSEISFCVLIELLKKYDAAADDDGDKCVTPR